MADSRYRRIMNWLDRTAGRLLLRSLAVLILIAGTGATWMGVSAVRRSLGGLSWPTAEGRVVESEVRRSRRSWRPVILYEYDVDAARYRGNGLGHPVRGAPLDPGGLRGWNQAEAEATVNRLAPGTAVAVHYRPGDPRWSVIEPRFAWATLIPLVAGIGFLVAGVWMWRTKKRLSEFDFDGAEA